MQNLALDETLLAKLAFKHHANEGGDSITTYWANNGCFADARFQKAIKDENPLAFVQSVHIIKTEL